MADPHVPRNTRYTPLRSRAGGVDHRGQWCRCGRCGRIAPCTVGSDFYSRALDDGTLDLDGPLVCEVCVCRGSRVWSEIPADWQTAPVPVPPSEVPDA